MHPSSGGYGGSTEEGVATSKSLSERLREAPQKIAGYLSETTKDYVAHVLGLV